MTPSIASSPIRRFIVCAYLFLQASWSSAGSDTPLSQSLFRLHPYLETLDRDELDKIQWLIKQRHTWSDQVVDLGTSLDAFLAGKENERRSNGSYVKVGLFGLFEENGQFSPDPRFKFRLDLPETQNRYRLVIESDSDDTLSPEERERQDRLNPDERTDTPASAFLRFLREQDDLQLSADVGVRVKLPITVFLRGKAIWKRQLDPNWLFRTETLPNYIINEGLIFNQAIYFERTISELALLRFRTEAQWSEEEPWWRYSEAASYTRQLNERTVIEYSIGWLGDSDPSFQTSGYYTRFTWRYQLYEDWLYADVSPQLFYDRATGFQDEASLTLGVEVFFRE